MSYSIFYRAMFIKMKDGTYIPMIESGDNNVWECDNKRRAREWSASRWAFETEEQRKRFSLTEEEIMADAQRDIDLTIERHPESTREAVMADLFDYNGIHISGSSNHSAARFLNFFKSGFRNAVTMEDLRGCVYLGWYEGGSYKKEFVETEEQLAEAWERLLGELGGAPWICLEDYGAERVWRDVKALTPRKPRVRREPTRWWLVSFERDGTVKWLHRLTASMLWHTPWADCAKKYATRKGAEHAASRIRGRFSGIDNVKVEVAK